jgi:hypothetical protein
MVGLHANMGLCSSCPAIYLHPRLHDVARRTDCAAILTLATQPGLLCIVYGPLYAVTNVIE